MRTTRCACGADIVFARITKRDGAPGHVPVDAKAPVYRVLIDVDTDDATAERAPFTNTEFYAVSHFATCPNADRFSKGKK